MMILYKKQGMNRKEPTFLVSVKTKIHLKKLLYMNMDRTNKENIIPWIGVDFWGGYKDAEDKDMQGAGTSKLEQIQN